MDKIKFAQLIGWLAKTTNYVFADDEISHMDYQISLKTGNKCDPDELHNLLKAMQAGEKIEAIKAHRSLTSYGLKESKDAVEKYWFTRIPENQI